ANDAGFLLIDNRVDGDRRLARLAVADDQLALPTADRDHAVDGLDAGLQRLIHWLALGDARGVIFQWPALIADDCAFTIQRPAQPIDHAADEALADGPRKQPARRPNRVAFLDAQVIAENDRADRVFLQIHDLADLAVLELHHLAGHGVGQAVDLRHAVAD